MKKFISLILLTILSTKCLLAEEPTQIKKILEEAKQYAESCRGDHEVHLQPKNPQQFFEEMSSKMNRGEYLTLVFYPKICGFDKLIGTSKPFMTVDDLYEYKAQYKFKLEYIYVHRPVLQFRDIRAVNNFTKKTFGEEITCKARNQLENQPHIQVPVRCIVAVLKKG